MQNWRSPDVARRIAVTTAMALMLTSLVPFALAAPTDAAQPQVPGAGANPMPSARASSLGTATAPPTKAPTATPTMGARATEGFVIQPSMGGDTGSSMGADAPAMPGSVTPVSASQPANASSLPTVARATLPLPTAVLVTATNPPSAATASMAVGSMACTPLMPGNAFAVPAFQVQWQAGEALAANFWGPAETPRLMETYADAAGGARNVQYFDKGRMELAGPNSVTNGLLATELITGQVQVGDATFNAKSAPAIPIAGDPDNAGPTYAALGTTAASLLSPAAMAGGQAVATQVAANGTVTSGAAASDPAMVLTAYDATTQHNLPQAFAQYRDTVGLATVGLAKSEPFITTVRVGGVPKQVMAQVFERRVLTYTADNDPAFRVEMGNIGLHYYRWRYCG